MANFLKSVFQDRRECAKVQQNEGQRVLQTAKVEAKTKSGAPDCTAAQQAKHGVQAVRINERIALLLGTFPLQNLRLQSLWTICQKMRS